MSSPDSITSLVRAAYIEQFGPPDTIRIGHIPAPIAGPTDVLVEVLCTTVNSVDALIRAGIYRVPVTFPFVIGRDAVGRIHGTGDLVWCNSLGHGGRQGAAAEQVVVPADRLYRLPDGVEPAEAVAVLHSAATAYLALFTHGHLSAGDTVLVAGAAGNVGSAAVTMAVAAGARVIATAAPDDADYCRSLGAEHVFDFRDPNVAQRLRDSAAHSVHVYLDTSGQNDLTLAIELLAARGRIIVFAGARSQPALPVIALFQKNASIHGFAISDATTAELARAAREVNRLLADGRLRARHVERRPLSDAAEVHWMAEQGELSGRRVVLETTA